MLFRSIGAAWRKLAGILCESTGRGGALDAIVVGTGINLQPAAYPPELQDRATSIEAELGRPVERAPIVMACLERLKAAIEGLRTGGGAALLAEWRRLGRAGLDRAGVRWHEHGVERRGRATDIDHDGALIVEIDGRVERIIAGEVLWDRRS